MADAPDPDDILRSTLSGKENFQRVTRLLISGGTSLLREIFDSICLPRGLPTTLSTPATRRKLKTTYLSIPQRHCLNPSPGVYGKAEDFDITLLFRLLRSICNLNPPSTGWDAPPVTTDHSLINSWYSKNKVLPKLSLWSREPRHDNYRWRVFNTLAGNQWSSCEDRWANQFYKENCMAGSHS